MLSFSVSHQFMEWSLNDLSELNNAFYLHRDIVLLQYTYNNKYINRESSEDKLLLESWISELFCVSTNMN